MKISTTAKKIIINLIILISLILTISVNYKTYIIDDNFNYLLFSISIGACIIAAFLFSIKLKTSNKVNLIISIISVLLSVFFSYVIIELLNKNTLFDLDIKRLIFNFIIIIILHLFIYALSNKINLTIILTNSLLFIIGIINYVVVCFRDAPFVPWDILSLRTAAYVASNYKFELSYYVLLSLSLFVLIVSIASKAHYEIESKKKNLILRFCILLTIIVTTVVFYNTDIINYFNLDHNLWSPKTEYTNNGFLASFIKQSKNLFIDAPDDYSIKNVKDIMSSNNYNSSSIKNTEDSPNIIVIMNEAFSDLRINSHFNTSEEFMPFYKSLKENTIKGNTYVSILGGGTPNSEWEFLTNNTMGFMPYGTVPYQQYIKRPSYSLATTLKAQGYTARAIHTWLGAGYRRNAVYPLLGFDTFDFSETLDNLENLRKFPSDVSTYNQIIKQFETKSKDEKLFNFTVTMQNHSGYDSKDYESSIFLTDIDNCPRVEQYLSLIKDSDEALEYLINYFKNYDEKTIILLFGDHQPANIEYEFWDIILHGEATTPSQYITPFVLWANYDIEEKYIDSISLNYLSILLLDVAGLQTTPYMNFLRNLHSELPVVAGNGYTDNEGNYYSYNDTTKYSNILKKYNFIQYNNVFDNNTIDSFFRIN